MAEAKIPVETNGKYNNIDLRKIPNGEFIIVTKKFAETKAYERESKFKEGAKYTFYSATATYGDKDVSFILNDADTNKRYNECGGMNDKVKISAKKEIVTKKLRGKDADVVETVYTFEKVM